MTTDITELAQRMKATAVRAKAATEDYVAHRMSITVCLEECKEFNDLSDGPDNILALVEALEKAQRANDHLREQSAEWERKAISNFQECATMSERIYLLESRTVKLPDLRQIVSGDRYVWSDGVYNYSQDVKVALTAAGIKWEAE